MTAVEKKVQIFNRDNCPCNYCKYCQIGYDYIYKCARRRHKAISALNPDIDSHWIVSDVEVSKCRCFTAHDAFKSAQAR